MARTKIKDLTSKLKLLPAEEELVLPFELDQMGQRMGGLSMFSNSFRAGFGDEVMGFDYRGFWLGGSDFDNALFKVTMAGVATATAMTLTGYVEDVGGQYDSAASGARVRIFPDANTGIRVLDNVAATVFEVLVGGANVGDVTVGNYAGGNGMLWDKSAGSLLIKGNVVAGSFSTAVSGTRIEMTADNSALKIYDSGGDLVGTLDEDVDNLFLLSGDGRHIILSSNGGLILMGGDLATSDDILVSGGNIFITNSGSLAVNGALTVDGFAYFESSFVFFEGYLTSTGAAIQIASGKNLFFAGTQGSIDCGDISCNTVDLNNNNLNDVAGIAGGGNAIIFYDQVNMNGHAVDNVSTINVNTIDVNTAGFVTLNDDLYVAGNMTVSSWQSFNGDLDMEGNDINDINVLNAVTKNFLIPHPDGSKRLLKYTAVEAPEVVVSYRGIVILTTASEFVPVPKHFELVTEEKGLITVQLTPIGNNPVYIKERPTNKGFTVVGAIGDEVMFEITAIRKGFLNNVVEIDLENPTSDFGKKYVKNLNEREPIKEAQRAEIEAKIEEEELKDIRNGKGN